MALANVFVTDCSQAQTRYVSCNANPKGRLQRRIALAPVKSLMEKYLLEKSVEMESNFTLKFINCSILRCHHIIREDLWVRNGKIIDPEKVFFDEKIVADNEVDCGGAIVAPGFIDLQINGGFGVDFSYGLNNIEGGVQKVAQGILAHGVTSFCPTVVTSKPEVYHKVLPRLLRNKGGLHGANVLGAHVEGPFISKLKKGAHDENSILEFQQGVDTLYNVYGSLDNISIVTLAPELSGAGEVIEYLAKKGISASLGHSVANLQEGLHAVHRGASLITHLFNAMLPFHHRDPGLVGLLSSDITSGGIVFYGIIADGVHTHPAALRIAYRTHPNGLVLVTDAISALGLQDGTHHIGQLVINVRENKAFIAGTDTLCGSIASMIECVKHFQSATGCSLVEALDAATLHPAQALGIEHVKGTLSFGADADLVLLNPNDLSVCSTWIGGECVYSSDENFTPILTKTAK